MWLPWKYLEWRTLRESQEDYAQGTINNSD